MQLATYSYFDGCSTGGREGYTEAQMYPGDFDGIMAASPVAKAAEVTVAMQVGLFSYQIAELFEGS